MRESEISAQSWILELAEHRQATAMEAAADAVLRHFFAGATLPDEHTPLADLAAALEEAASVTEIDRRLRELSHAGYLRGAVVAIAANLKRAPRADLALRLAAELMDALRPELGIELARAVIHDPLQRGIGASGREVREAANLLLADYFLGHGDQGGALRHFEAVLAEEVDHERALRGWANCVRALEQGGLLAEHRSRGMSLIDGLEELELAGAAGLERYDIGRPLGRGRHAVVYQAYDRHVGREVAIKRLLGDGARQDDVPGHVLEARFFAEARTLARVRSPHVVALLDVAPRGRFIALELCLGGNLRLALRRGLVDARDTPRIAAQLRIALAAVHATGAVHRDVKPANILVREMRPRSDVALADFGLAVHGAKDPGGAQMSGRAGTLRYLAPEVREGAPATAAADLFSAGVVLLELALAPRPLPASFDHVDSGREPSDDLPDSLPPSLRADLTRLLSRNPEARRW